jgi:hypothetical protein
LPICIENPGTGNQESVNQNQRVKYYPLHELFTAMKSKGYNFYPKYAGYIADLRAATQMDTDIKILCMHSLGIPHDRIAKQMGINQASIHNHLLKMATLPNLINADLARGFTVAQVAEKHGWPEPMV